MTKVSEISMQVVQARKMRNLNQEELADLTGLSNQLISRLESGSEDPTVSTLKVIANALNCSFIIGNKEI